MDDPRVRIVIEKALARGIISAGHAQDAIRLHGDEMKAGRARGVVELLRDVSGVEERLLAGLDDRSMIGRALGGFQIHSKIGEGGMGAVYRATQTSLGRSVALKILDPSLACRPELSERFRREARAAARLDHPHVVQPIDFGEEHGFIFFAMELMEGGSAASRLIERGPFPEADALDVAIAVARALEYAQERGLVHRDIKPDNILFNRYGTPKLADLGLVLEMEGTEQITAPGIAMGTPHYMSPEQALGQRDLDVRSDMYALGATLFEILTGRTPYHGPSATSILTQHVSTPFPDVRELAPHVSLRLAGLLGRLTAKKREERFDAAHELREALEEAREALLSGQGSAGYTVAPPGGEPPLPLASRGGDGTGATGPTRAATPAPGAPAVAVAEPPAAPVPAEPALAPLPSGTALAPLPPAAAPPRRLGRVALLAAVALAAVAVIGWPRLFGRTRGPRIDPTAEADAANGIRDLLMSRKAEDGGFGLSYSAPSDPWTTSQAFVALSTLERQVVPPDQFARLIRRIEATRLTKPEDAGPGLLGWPTTPMGGDTAAVVEAGSWVGISFAVAGNGHHVTSRDRDRVRAHLLAAQAPDGGFMSVPAGGAQTVRTSGTALAMAALVMLETQDGSPRPHILDAIERAAAWLGEHYDRGRHVWFPNPAHAFGNRSIIHGISEFSTWALLEADALLAASGRKLPPVAREAIQDFAASYVPVNLPPGTLANSHVEDYIYDLPPGARTSFHGVRWVWSAWRLLAAERLARTPGMPRPKEWAAEALRLRSEIPQLRRALDDAESPPWQISECLVAVNLIRGHPADDPKAGSLYHWLKGRK